MTRQLEKMFGKRTNHGDSGHFNIGGILANTKKIPMKHHAPKGKALALARKLKK
jgi:hypothetical protein